MMKIFSPLPSEIKGEKRRTVKPLHHYTNLHLPAQQPMYKISFFQQKKGGVK